MQDLIQAYLAKNEVTKCPTGKTTMTATDMRRACGYEKTTMLKYLVAFTDECRTPVTEVVTAYDTHDAEMRAMERWPEGRDFMARPYYVGGDY